MAQTTLSIRTDEQVKKQLDAFKDPFYSDANMQRLKQAAERMEASSGIAHELMEVDDEVEPKRKTIKELFADYHGDYHPSELDWGEPVGDEI